MALLFVANIHELCVLSIDTSAAEALPGVEAVVTADDIPGENKIGHLKQISIH